MILTRRISLTYSIFHKYIRVFFIISVLFWLAMDHCVSAVRICYEYYLWVIKWYVHLKFTLRTYWWPVGSGGRVWNCCGGDSISLDVCTRVMINHYGDVMMRTMAPQITSLMIVYSTVYSGGDQRKHQSSASLAFVRGIHRWPANSPHKGPVTRKMFPFNDIIIMRNTFSITHWKIGYWCYILRPRPRFYIKTIFRCMGIPIIKKKTTVRSSYPYNEDSDIG